MGCDWLILADDLTGAADCGIAFARRGAPAVVAWGDHAPSVAPGRGVLSYDVDSRGYSAEEAAARHRAALDRLLVDGMPLYKKIDSTWRGQPAVEIAACLAALRERGGRGFAVLAPAFPATGRTIVGGHVHVSGRPLEEADVWRREHTYDSADLVAVLASAGLVGEVLPLSAIRAGREELQHILGSLAERGDVVVICDAEVEDDLARIATATMTLPSTTLYAGSGGFAHALAEMAAGVGAAPASVSSLLAAPIREGGTLMVVGTLAAMSRRAARRTVDEGHVRHVSVDPALLLDRDAVDARGRLIATLSAILAAGDDAMVEVAVDDSPDLSIGHSLAVALADLLHPVLPHAGALAATGGETAAALLSRFGVTSLRLVDEIEPGVCLGLTVGAVSLPVITKAGAFGDEDSLTRIIQHLRHIRHTGPTP